MQCEAEKVQLPILRSSTLERALLERGLPLSCWVKWLFLTLAEGPPIHWADHLQGRKGGLLSCFRVNIQLVAALCPCAAQPSPLLAARLSSEFASEWVYTLMPALFPFLQPCEHRIHEERVFLSLTSPVTWERAQCSVYSRQRQVRTCCNRVPPSVQDIQDSTEKISIWGVISSRKIMSSMWSWYGKILINLEKRHGLPKHRLAKIQEYIW